MIDYIAEVSSNHNCDIARMEEFIYASSEAGCTGVKFQLFKINSLFAPEILRKSAMHRKRKSWELPEKYIPRLSELTRKLGMKFSCTPFYLEAVDELEPYVDFYKIASYELLWLDLFEKCGRVGKPVVFSTGMAIAEEVISALKLLFKTNANDITVLHCNSAYPTPVKDANLYGIKFIKDLINGINTPGGCKIDIGYSDHTVSPAVLYRAVHKYEANFIEFHLDLDKKGEEYKSGHCWLPEQISDVISNINKGFESDGKLYFGPSDSELSDRDWRADPEDGLRPLKKIRESFEK